jgi:predicted dehydrogenase
MGMESTDRSDRTPGRPIRLGMIGCGMISDRFFKQAAELDDVRFVATCAAHLASAQAKAQAFGVERHFDSVQTMLAEVPLDGVVVTTPHSLHAACALPALARGIAVLVEKPMTTAWDDAVEMVQTARRSGAMLMSLPFDSYPSVLRATEFLTEEWLGKITGAEGHLSLPGPPRDNWYYRRQVAHGGAMLDCLVYPASRILSLLGPARRVTGMVGNLIPKRLVGDVTRGELARLPRVDSDVDDNVTLVLELAGGQQVVLRSLWGTSFIDKAVWIHGRQGALLFPGSHQELIIHSPRRPVEGAERITWGTTGDCYKLTFPAMTGRELMLGHFVDCLRSGRPPHGSGEMQLHVHEVLFRGYEAARTGTTQELTTSFEPWHRPPASLFDTRSDYL